jgi:hypothetical protein
MGGGGWREERSGGGRGRGSELVGHRRDARWLASRADAPCSSVLWSAPTDLVSAVCATLAEYHKLYTTTTAMLLNFSKLP